ncbi:hypothetical protein CDAR_472601 [Caerostris darwini]|uniref:Uncharacterized protein n=1 Tax=Caerostris darwini TaxID=1538125 RepID=A0AAV4TKS8_9ARAC|nr:hypothetical protein CDAR_302241 [Caerostris darwini]GIY46031.1 hypothetical protein CDAR_472601 [Caerostris darwini]
MKLINTYQLSKKSVIVRNLTSDLILFSRNIASAKKSIWSNDLWCEGEISDSFISFMASYSPEHSDGGINHSDPLGCHSRKVGNRLSDSRLSLLLTTYAISEISCAAFRQEAQQYLGNGWDREWVAARNVINKRGLMLMGVRCNKFALEVLGWRGQGER